ncbi:tRNA uridine-5-carboxymethylaminomethyl(34) synthesis GTPase MnmE [Maribacter sp. HTCC2170]|uniref:tRNA uridine-5-carboxymethylaminomethyl(34) synthesis GTPase MnmE n=1 Tax=Maribacter sp. (strain HTCC2170 / KCCM 42371) TaxID=313603 RepID=UPI00006B4953|nr:tRNA uridine-5-carboxymethylaminomethyl(34) synthesis GTPase MnmE [Maribacter sp. HTCC2170]EAR01130.1 tRNA modification GTPase [Maribacter sp. HTCC2170]
MNTVDTIVALATPAGSGAIAVIRLSGKDAKSIAGSYFRSIHGKDLSKQKSHTIHLGHIIDGDVLMDEVLLSIFNGPNSYTGEDVIEISCHGSPYIQQQIIQLFLRNGCRMAEAGEFTLRAFLNGKLDLSQAEAVADLIASENETTHQIAIQQMRGGFSNEIKLLRDELMNFASLIELELDFAEEDVEFADRLKFQDLILRIQNVLKKLIDSFAVGNVIKKGIPVAIVGEPNVGKSTLLNALLNEEKAIVSDIAGTTRDAIEDEIAIGGIGFRFIDTAGIRDTKDIVENIGIKKTFEKIEQSQVVLFLHSAEEFQNAEISLTSLQNEVGKISTKHPNKPLVIIVNKIDILNNKERQQLETLLSNIEGTTYKLISAKTGESVEDVKNMLLNFVNTGALRNNETIVTNTRHYDALLKALEEIQKVQHGMDNHLSGDLLAIDIRQALHHFGEITGEITSDDLLGNIFANFCIGK